MNKKTSRKAGGRPGLLPPLGVDFETALDALLKTPPPVRATAQKPATKRKRGRPKRVAGR